MCVCVLGLPLGIIAAYVFLLALKTFMCLNGDVIWVYLKPGKWPGKISTESICSGFSTIRKLYDNANLKLLLKFQVLKFPFLSPVILKKTNFGFELKTKKKSFRQGVLIF